MSSNSLKEKSGKLYDKLLKTSSVKIHGVNSTNIPLSKRLFSALFTVTWNSAILSYLYNLEDPTCKCIRDWRHDFMKYIAYLNLTMTFLPLIIINIKFHSIIIRILEIIIILLNITNIYALYTYVTVLNDTKCTCATNQSKLNFLLNDEKNITLGLYILGVITVVTGISINIGYNKTTHSI